MAQEAILAANGGPILAALADGRPIELNRVPQSAPTAWIRLTDPEGIRIYQRSVSFLLCAAAHELFPGARLVIEHSLSNGLYVEFRGGPPMTPRLLSRLSDRMRQLVGRDLPITRRDLPLEQARRFAADQGRTDLSRLFATLDTPTVPLYECAAYLDYASGVLASRTGELNRFRLDIYLPGLILQTPDPNADFAIGPFVDQPRLAEVHRECERWGEQLDIAHVGALNELIAQGHAGDLIRISEALHEKRIVQITERIQAQRPTVRIILIAGPSSSGKTTFAQRLRTQLRADGLRPVALSLDNYFVDREATPRDENGQYDYESIEALDLDLFNQQLAELIQGETVELPAFDFQLGKRVSSGRKLTLGPDQPLIIEGIHGLNERLTASIPKRAKYKIYVSALTQLNITDHVRIPTRDVRFCRRLVRDHLYRGASAAHTFEMWPSVRRGEERNIFPFQEGADIMFSSALPFELSVLKRPAEELLAGLDERGAFGVDIVRIKTLLSHFLPLDAAEIPTTSILREFVGGGCYAH
ncbi:MAG TPA: nucleoside kinase [Limnochordia bacterium]|nr:nucleoside kinase [Limnochordia bacterium]